MYQSQYLVPQELVELATGLAQLPAVDQARHLILHGFQTGSKSSGRPGLNSVVRAADSACRTAWLSAANGRVCPARFMITKRAAFQILLAKLRLASTRLSAQLHVVAGRATGEQRKTQRIGAIFGDQIKRVERVVQALAHLAALFVAHQTV